VIRRIYLELALARLRRGELRWLAGRALQYLGVRGSLVARRGLCAPILGTIVATYRCNLHCAMCDLPLVAGERRRAGRPERDTAGMLEVVDALARLGVPGIGYTGGEPLLRDDIFELLARTRARGLIAHLNTNALLLDPARARELTATGVDSVAISLDGACAATHDRIRSRPGAFEQALAGVRTLLEARRVRGARLRLKLVTVLQAANLGEVEALLDLGGALGVDSMEFIPRQPFEAAAGGAVAPEALGPRVDEAVRRLRRHRGAPRLENSPGHLALFRGSFEGRPSPLRCTAAYSSIAVDCHGDVFPCVPWVNWGRRLGNLAETPLADFARAPGFRQIRQEIGACRGCTLNCQAELNLLFDRGAAPRA
jgi:MoaA/NifB/PqqE/SkfB family radical SAM enzyme